MSISRTATEAQLRAEMARRFFPSLNGDWPVDTPSELEQSERPPLTYKGFTIGDRIICIEAPEGRSELVGLTGTIKNLFPIVTDDLCIIFDNSAHWDCKAEMVEHEKDLRVSILK